MNDSSSRICWQFWSFEFSQIILRNQEAINKTESNSEAVYGNSFLPILVNKAKYYLKSVQIDWLFDIHTIISVVCEKCLIRMAITNMF